MLFKTAQTTGGDPYIVTVADSGYLHRIDSQFVSHFDCVVTVDFCFLTFLVAVVLNQLQQLLIISVSH
jgi:hypothetical protein